MGSQLVEVFHLPNLKTEAYILFKRVNLWPMNGRAIFCGVAGWG